MSVIAAFIVPHPPLIFPEVGKGEEKIIQKTIDSYRSVADQIAEIKPETVILTSPHSIAYADYFHISPGASASGNFSQFRAPQVKMQVSYDEEFVRLLSDNAKNAGISAGTSGERDPNLDHGTIIPLRFIQEKYQDFKLVRIGLSGFSLLDHYEFGKVIAETAEQLERRTVFVASGDMSHKLKVDGPYGFAAEGPIFDKQASDAMAAGDFLKLLKMDPNFSEKAAVCGINSFVIMAGALDGKSVDPELLSYEGPFGVGYAVASFHVTGNDPSRCFDKIIETEIKAKREQDDPYLKLARASLEYYIKTGKILTVPKDLPKDMLTKQAGVFVSLHKSGTLRGCIGTIYPVRTNIADEIIENAISAGTHDPRFEEVREDELKDLVYDVDILKEPETIDLPDQLDIKRYGVIVSHGSMRGLLLPNLDGVDSIEQQIDIARRKAGIPKGLKMDLQRFEVIRHEEK